MRLEDELRRTQRLLRDVVLRLEPRMGEDLDRRAGRVTRRRPAGPRGEAAWRALAALAAHGALLLAAPAHAQGLVGGIALDARTGEPLPCPQVVLEDSTGATTARTLTAADGVFQLTVVRPNRYRLRFQAWGIEPQWRSVGMLDSTAEHTAAYPLTLAEMQVAPAADRVAARDRPPAPLGLGMSRPFPGSLGALGVDGIVRLRLVIDTTGRVAPQSVVLVGTVAGGFADAARGWASRMLYTPAEMDGRRVCALALQRFEFTQGGDAVRAW